MNLNQYITEGVMKKAPCDNWIPIGSPLWGLEKRCTEHDNCYPRNSVPDYSQPGWWWELWEFCKGQKWWKKFWLSKCYATEYLNPYVILNTIDLKAFPEAIAKFHGWEGDK